MVQATGKNNYSFGIAPVLPDGNGGFSPCPTLLTEDELIRFLRIDKVSKANDYHNVIVHLKRMHNLPCVHICGQPLYYLEDLCDWLKDKRRKESS